MIIAVFAHACKVGLEGIFSKRLGGVTWTDLIHDKEKRLQEA
jgi:hypothetical protein